MISTVLFAACRRVLIDKETNSTSLIELLEDFETQGLPTMLPVVSLFWDKRRDEGDPLELTAELEISSGGVSIGRYPVIANFQGKNRHRSVIRFEQFVISTPGETRFVLRLGENVLAETGFVVSVPDTPPVVAPA